MAKKKEQISDGKMTIYEYEQKYTKKENTKGAKFLLTFLAAALGIIIFFCLFSLTSRVYDFNKYAGYGVGAFCLILYIVFFIVPLIRIMKLGHFVTNVTAKTARKAQKHNKKLRREIAVKIIEVTNEVDGVTWYDQASVGQLAVAVQCKDEEGIKKCLTALYGGSVKKSAKEMIFKSSLKTATFSALSQTAKVDAALVAVLNLQLIKDIVFLYGFRPSDAKLVKIFGRVVANSLVAYGLGGIKIGNSVAQTMGNAVKGIPILGSAISAIVDSSVQGLTNGTLTAVIGYQTIKYLNDEYRLQDILDGIEITETEEELRDTCSEIEKELKKEKKLAAKSA